MKYLRLFVYYVFYIVFAIYFFSVVSVNLDLTQATSLWMDEHVFFIDIVHVYEALTSAFNNLVTAISGNFEFRYGQMLIVLYSVTSAIPALLFGDSGLIFATRMTQVVLLFCGYFILVSVFVRNTALRLFILSLLLLLNTTWYYSTMPKPEPLQIFILGIFFYIFKYKGIGYWVLYFILGFLVGVKISALPFVLFCLALNVYRFAFVERQSIKRTILKTSKYCALILFGFFVCMPGVLFGAHYYISTLFAQSMHYDTMPTGFLDWLWTRPLSWIQYIFSEYYYSINILYPHDASNYGPLGESIVEPVFVFAVLFIGCVYLFFYALNNFKKHQDSSDQIFKNEMFAIMLLIICSVSYGLPIILFVQRLWGLYLHISMTLFIISSVLGFYVFFQNIQRKHFILRFLCLVPVVFSLFLYVRTLGYTSIRTYQTIVSRSQLRYYTEMQELYTEIQQFFAQKAKEKSSASDLKIAICTVESYFLFFIAKDKYPGYIMHPIGAYFKKITTQHFDFIIIREQEFSRHLSNREKEDILNNGFCSNFCYKRIPFPRKGVYVFQYQHKNTQ